MNISEPFIRRPVATTLMTIALAISGVVSYRFLPVAPLPQVDYPTVSVNAELPGASPETMSSSVATPLERMFGRIAGVTEMTSYSALGQINVTLQFELDRDIDAAARDVQAAINAARGQLPTNLPSNPTYRKVNPADAPIMLLALTSDLYDRARMYDVASSILQQKLSQIAGVGLVTIDGGALPAVRVTVNPGRLNALGLSLEDLRKMLASANTNRPKGEISGADHTWTLYSTDQLFRAQEYRRLIVAFRNGAAVRLGDVAQVTDSLEDNRLEGQANGVPAIVMIVYRQPGANIIETVDRIRTILPRLAAQIPQGLDFYEVGDRTMTIRASVHDVEMTLILSVFLVVLVVFVFLRNLRATLIPSVAVPLSLVGTFGVMYVAGYSLDNLSLMALTIATGFVVDDAIVVIENVTRHLQAGATPLEAALVGASEIGFTVISMSLSLVAVFIPILLMGGIMGRLFREFAVVLSAAIGVSMVISLTTTPMMCAMLLEPHAVTRKRAGWFHRAGEWVLDGVLWLYEITLRCALRHQFLVFILTLATAAYTMYLFLKVDKGFFPQQDTGRLAGMILADQDTSAQAMRQILSKFVAVVAGDEDISDVVAFSAAYGGRMFCGLKPLGQRKSSADEVVARLRTKSAQVPGAILYLQVTQDLRIGAIKSSAQYQYTLQGDDLQTLSDWAPRVVRRLESIEGLDDVDSGQQDRGLQATLTIDRMTASRLGLSPKLIDDTLYDAFGQRQVSTMYNQLNQYHVVMEVKPQFNENPEGLRYVYLTGSGGKQIPLSTVARYSPTAGPLSVNHKGFFPSVTISFNLVHGFALSSAVERIEKATIEMGLPGSIQGTFSGTLQAFLESLSTEPYLILAAILAVYIVLGMLYESTIHPITILSTIPSAGVGALLALRFCDTELSVIALIGIILLIGIVKKNAILMIDFALNAERREGKPPEEAIFEACLLRFRPIIMTTMAALLGGLPLALGTGTGSELRRPLGIAIVGGLMLSQLLTLYTTPVVYLYLGRLQRWGNGLYRLAIGQPYRDGA
ncbi:MAG: efflux RND transporter permease subunit [Candidatus Riflebacteria bacterium]|nr:efflux RND transporter permease subunit [Candidatus Riflebacteria bacterium]